MLFQLFCLLFVLLYSQKRYFFRLLFTTITQRSMQKRVSLPFFLPSPNWYCEKMGVKCCDSVKRKHKGSLHIFFVIICNTDCGFKLKAWCVWFDLFSYCKECSGLLTIITLFLNSCFVCCGLTIISLHNLPYNYCLMCVCVFTFVFDLPFLLDSLFLISYRFLFTLH